MKKILFVLVSLVAFVMVSCGCSPAEIAEKQKTDSISAEQLAKEKWEADSLYYMPGILKSLSEHSVGSPMIMKDLTITEDSLKIVMTAFKDGTGLDFDLSFDLDLALQYINISLIGDDTDFKFDAGLWEETSTTDLKTNKEVKCLERKIYIQKNLIFCSYFPESNVLFLIEFIGWEDYKVINHEPASDIFFNIDNYLK